MADSTSQSRSRRDKIPLFSLMLICSWLLTCSSPWDQGVLDFATTCLLHANANDHDGTLPNHLRHEINNACFRLPMHFLNCRIEPSYFYLAYDAAHFTGHQENDVPHRKRLFFLSCSTSPRSGRVVGCKYAPHVCQHTYGSSLIFFQVNWISYLCGLSGFEPKVFHSNFIV